MKLGKREAMGRKDRKVNSWENGRWSSPSVVASEKERMLNHRHVCRADCGSSATNTNLTRLVNILGFLFVDW